MKADPLRVLELYRKGIKASAIAERLGISRPHVYNLLPPGALNRRGFGRPMVECFQCHQSKPRWRARTRKSARAFCSAECYQAHRRSFGYREWRQGTRIARFIVKESGFDLRQGMIVHHIDHDQTNNRLDNLAVFASSSDHLSFHHHLPGCAQPIATWCPLSRKWTVEPAWADANADQPDELPTDNGTGQEPETPIC